MRNDFESNYLMHHGILGQKWGQQNGPPYPLDSNKHSASEKKAGWMKSLKEKSEAKKKAKKQKAALEKARKARAEKAKKEQIAKEYEADKQKVLTSGKASEVYKYQGAMSNKELGDAVQRIRWETELREMSAKEQQTNFQKIDAVMKRTKDVTNWAKIGIDTYNTMAEVHNTFYASKEDDLWPRIGWDDNADVKKDKKEKQKNRD